MKFNTKRTYYKTIFESSTPGEYPISLNHNKYKITLIGGGGGISGTVRDLGAGWTSMNYSGGSGSLITANFIRPENVEAEFTITIGAGGTPLSCNQFNTIGGAANAGGDSILSIGDVALLTSGGGIGGRAPSNVGAGGTPIVSETFKNDYAINNNILTQAGVEGNHLRQNNNGSGWCTGHCYGAISVYTGTTDGYGAGGGSVSKAPYNAQNGYCKIDAVVAPGEDYDYVVEDKKYKAIKETTTKYYKYEYEPWEQPVLTSSGIMGGSSFAVAQSSSHNGNDFWKVFNNSQWHSASGLPQWVSWYNPKPLKISKLFFKGHGSGNIGNFIVQASNDNKSWINITSYSNTNKTGDFEVELPENAGLYQYWRLYITSCYYGSYPLIAYGFRIIAQTQVTVIKEAETVDLSKNKYWKYAYEPWEQPVLTSDTSSDEITLSASSNYSNGYDMYKAFDNSTSTGWLSADGTYSGSLRVKTKDTLSISSITVVGLSIANGYTKSVAIYKDFDNTELIGETQTFTAGGTITWTFEEPIETSMLSFYAVGSYKWGCIAEIKINANKKIIQAGTSEDYDFITNEDYDGIFEDKKYKAIKETTTKYWRYKNYENDTYREVEWVITPANCSIDTGVIGKSDLITQIDFIPLQATLGLGVGHAAGEYIDYRMFNSSNYAFFDMGGYGSASRIEISGACTTGTRYHYEYGNYYIKNLKTGSLVGSLSAKSYTTDYTMKIYSYTKFYSLKIWDKEELIRDYAPCYRVADGVIGFYDKINGTFITDTSVSGYDKGELIIEKGNEQDYSYTTQESKYYAFR